MLTASLDNFSVALSYGVNKIRIGPVSNLAIAVVSAVFTLLSMSIGSSLRFVFSAAAANWIGNGLLILIGIGFAVDYFKTARRGARHARQGPENGEKTKSAALLDTCKDGIRLLDAPEEADKDRSGEIDLRESLLLGAALSLNNVGMGIGASISGFNVALTTVLTLICSILMIFLGERLGGAFLSKVSGRYSGLVSALLILLIGVYGLIAG